jgi:hypothetical protein
MYEGHFLSYHTGRPELKSTSTKVAQDIDRLFIVKLNNPVSGTRNKLTLYCYRSGCRNLIPVMGKIILKLISNQNQNRQT